MFAPKEEFGDLQGPSQQTQNIFITFVQRRPNVFDVGPTLYKCFVFAGLALSCDAVLYLPVALSLG